MQTITPRTIDIKVSDDHTDKHVLVHDGKRVLAFTTPGARVGTHPRHTMLAGTRRELEAEIKRLKLAPLKTPAQRHAAPTVKEGHAS